MMINQRVKHMAGAGVEHKKEKASSFKKLLSAFFSEIALGVEREDSIGLDAGGAGSVAKRWRRPRSEPEYTERRSDAVHAAKKCAYYPEAQAKSPSALCPWLSTRSDRAAMRSEFFAGRRVKRTQAEPAT